MKDVEALETLDEYDDADYGAYLEYTELKDRCMIEPSVLYIHENHEFLSEFRYFNKLFLAICLCYYAISLF